MNCRQVERLLSHDFEGLVSRRQAAGIVTHLRHCAPCRRLRDDLAAAGEALRAPLEWPRTAEIDRRAIESWQSEREAGGARLRPDGRRRPGLRFLAGRPLALGAAAAALLLASLGPALLHRQRGPAQGGVRYVDRGNEEGNLGAQASRPRPGRHDASVTIPASRPRRSPHDRGAGSAGPPAHRAPRSTVPPRDDLTSLNGNPVADARWWAPARANDWRAIEATVRRDARSGDDFVQIPLPQLADVDGRQMAAAVEQYRREAAVVDARLSRNVTVAQKETALSDLCDHLREETGIRLAAGSSVADEKVTLFCKAMPLRDVMRQLSRPFGYTWIRSGKAGDHRYELVQDLRSQLLEEELRNRDRSESLLALERDLQRYAPT
jgi:hypothetical protein